MNQLPDTNNQGISDQSDNLPEIKTLMVNEMPTLIVQEDRYDGSYRDWETDRKSTRLNSSHRSLSRMPSSA